jgi:FAD/FMN-containing dehydrogenase
MSETATLDRLQELRAQVRGDVLESEQDGARGVFNAMHPSNAAVTVLCSGTADVVAGVNFARGNDMPLAVRGGGHSIAGLSAIDGGVLLDLSPMRGVQVDPERRLATVQGGALWGDVDREAQAFGLAAPGGVVSDTGVAGLTLGGGYGWLRRKLGLSLDALVEAQVVCADGEVRQASAESNPDLFWALRGGGGNFGVVTSFTFALQPVGPIVAFSATFYPIEEAGQILRGWRAYAETAPDEVAPVAVTLTFPADPEMPEAIHNRPVLIVGAVYAGDPEEGMRVTAPLRELGTPLFDMSGPMPYTAVQSGFDPLFPRGALRAYWKSHYLDELSDEAIDLFATKALERPKPLTLLNLYSMGGAIARVDPEATAFAERKSAYMLSIDGVWDEEADDAEMIGWVRSTHQAIGEFGNGGAYLNFTGLADEAPTTDVDSALGRNLARLQQVKATYDPDNLFRLNNNIQPARSGEVPAR